MTRNDMKNPNTYDTDKDQNLSGNQSGASFKKDDANREGKSQGQAYERAGNSQSQKGKGSDWTPGDESDVGTRFDQKRDDTDAKRGPGRTQTDTDE